MQRICSLDNVQQRVRAKKCVHAAASAGFVKLQII